MLPVILHGLGAIVLMIASMTPKADQPEQRPDGKVWRLVELRGESFAASATFTFPAPDRIAGVAPCNRYSTTNSAIPPLLDAGPIAATRMACPDLAAESEFFAALEDATLSEVTDNMLILSDDTGALLVFKADD